MKTFIIIIVCLGLSILSSVSAIDNTEGANVRLKIVELNEQIDSLRNKLENIQSINDSQTTTLNKIKISDSIYSRGIREDIFDILKILAALFTAGMALLGINIWKKQKKWEFQQLTINSILDSYSSLKTHVFYEKSLMDEYFEIVESFIKSEEYDEIVFSEFVATFKTKFLSLRENMNKAFEIFSSLSIKCEAFWGDEFKKTFTNFVSSFIVDYENYRRFNIEISKLFIEHPQQMDSSIFKEYKEISEKENLEQKWSQSCEEYEDYFKKKLNKLLYQK